MISLKETELNTFTPIDELEELLMSDGFIDSYVNAQLAIAIKQDREQLFLSNIEELRREEANVLRRELDERRWDPALWDALSGWGKSPNSKGERGEEGLGYNAGVAHYFEYRTVPKKDKRFSSNEPPTIQGFIDFTRKLSDLLRNPLPRNNSDMAMSSAISDGKRTRFTLLTKTGFFIVGFQNQIQDDPRLITWIPGQTSADFVRDLNNTLEGNHTSSTRVNILGENKTLVYFAKAAQTQ